MLEKQGDSTELDDHTNGSADEADDDSGSGGKGFPILSINLPFNFQIKVMNLKARAVHK